MPVEGEDLAEFYGFDAAAQRVSLARSLIAWSSSASANSFFSRPVLRLELTSRFAPSTFMPPYCAATPCRFGNLQAPQHLGSRPCSLSSASINAW